MKRKQCTRIIWIASIIRILLQMGIPIVLLDSFYDDELLVHYAHNIFTSGWLGAYDDCTLLKVPGFSLFLAAIRTLNIPYTLALGIAYCLAAYLFFVSFCKIVENEALSLLCYLYVLFSPAMLDFQIVQRVYRMSIIPILVLLVVVSYLSIYAERNHGLRGLLPWSIVAGLAFSLFYLTREDAIWFCCFIFGASILIAGTYWIENRKRLDRRNLIAFSFCLSLPVLLCLASVNILKKINYDHYGIYATNDFKDTYYAKMGKKILEIKPEKEIDQVWVSHSTIEKLYELSPTFSTLKESLEALYIPMDRWGYGTEDGEIEKDYVIWAIRWAALAEGVYDSDGAAADEFYRQIDEEIESAFASGELEKRDKIVLSNLARPFEISELPQVMSYFLSSFKENIDYSQMQCQIREPDNGTDRISSLFLNMTESNTMEKDSVTSVFGGWMFSLDEKKELEAEVVDENGVVYPVDFVDSQDVYDSFSHNGSPYDQAKKCRFSLELEDVDLTDGEIHIYMDGELAYSGKIADFTGGEENGIVYHIDEYSCKTDTNYSKVYAAHTVKAANWVIGVYQATGKGLLLFSIFIFLWEFAIDMLRLYRREKTYFSLWLIKLGLLLTVFGDYLIVSLNYFDAYNRGGANFLYTIGTVPIMQLFICLSAGTAFLYIRWKMTPTSIGGE